MQEETPDIVLGAKVSKTLYNKILGEQARLKKETGIEPNMSQIVRMLIEKGIEANGKRR